MYKKVAPRSAFPPREAMFYPADAVKGHFPFPKGNDGDLERCADYQ